MADPYTVVELGTFGGAYSEASAINDNGQIVGRAAHLFAPASACVWHALPGDDPINLGAAWTGPINPIQMTSSAEGIGPTGKIVGWTGVGSERHATLYAAGAFDLSAVLGKPYSLAYDINAQDLVVGTRANAVNDESNVPFICDLSSSTVIDIPDVLVGEASAVNAKGQVAGSAYAPDEFGGWWAFFYDNGTTTFITKKPGMLDTATDINDSGQVVGEFSQKPFIYSPDEDLNVLDVPGGIALAINEAGHVVGYQGSGNQLHAWLYTPKEGVVMLDTLLPPNSGWKLMRANDINSHGNIVGVGEHDGKKRGFLLIPPTSKERQLQQELAIDPVALVLSGRLYGIWAEMHHPHVARERIQETMRSMTPERRRSMVERAATLVAYASSVRVLQAVPPAHRLSKLHAVLLSLTDAQRVDVAARARLVVEIGRELGVGLEPGWPVSGER